ncbi:MAG: ATP-grasp domain-containing protein [Atopobiaceae bacterium]|jgi:carbamoyl-phosphate synthase large subunit|nr:ATP-grasp domain-containing protein [Atopobiaceae bacterium]
MHVALVTAIGSFSADIVIKRLKRLGLRVVGCDIYPFEWIADAANVDAFRQAPLASDAEAYARFIRDFCKDEHVDVIIPLTDVEVDLFNLARDAAWLGDAVPLISPKETVDLCRNKDNMARFLRSSGSGVLGIETRPLLECISGPVELPVVCKPLDGRSSEGLRRIRTATQWKSVEDIEDPARYVVQPLIEGPVVTVDIVRDSAGHVVAIPREELLRTLNGAGTSVRVFHDERLAETCCSLASELGILGCVNFEFIAAASGGYRFLECNPRFSGGVEFSCMAAYDCVGNHVRAFAGDEIEPMAPYPDQYIARKYEEYVTKVDEG